MAQVFISYGSADEQYALRMYNYLKENGFTAWFAPFDIRAGRNFAEEIGRELGWDLSMNESEKDDQRIGQFGGAQVIILLLSKNSMNSPWVKKEVSLAISESKRLLPVQIDHEKLTYDFKFKLVDVQITQAYHLAGPALEAIIDQLLDAGIEPETPKNPMPQKHITYWEMGIESITRGDPYYVNGYTLRTILTPHHFYLSPPGDLISEETQTWAKEHFAHEDTLFSLSWEEICASIPIEDLRDRIESSRNKIFLQFLHQENGCYYNNKKFGVYNIRPYGRTEDCVEIPVLEMELFTTDYFTHRVMKDVCKSLISDKNPYMEKLRYANLGANRIFFTSLGINLLLTDSAYRENPQTILTSRSTNASETYDRRQYSVSVIEGVSLSDYDSYTKTVNIEFAVLRGLQEELGVKDHMVKKDSLRFYELFVNHKNLEMGLTCSIELIHDLSVQKDVLPCHGKDEIIEIAEKRVIPLSDLARFVMLNQQNFLPQALFTALSYCESEGASLIDRHHIVAMAEENFLMGKDGRSQVCGDAIYQSEHFMAVIDGATPKGTKLWDGKPGHVYVAELLRQAMEHLPQESTAQEAIVFLNEQVRLAYQREGIDFSALPPEEQLQASVIIYSAARREIWNFGDCKLRINMENYNHTKQADILLSNLRAFCMEAARISGNVPTDSGEAEDYGRMKILPFLKEQPLFANTDYSFGYDVINGGNIRADHIRVYAIQKGDHVVMATDGYPQLFDTLSECEAYLHDALQADRECMYLLRGTKGVRQGNESYDDRAFLSFVVE